MLLQREWLCVSFIAFVWVQVPFNKKKAQSGADDGT